MSDETFMSKTAGLTFGLLLVALCVVAVALGSYLLVVSSGMQPHTDEARADELSRLYEDAYINAPEQLEPIRQKIVALRTSKWGFYDAGLALCLLFGTLLIGVFHFALWDLRNLRAVQTPRSRWRLLMLATIALLALLPALIWVGNYGDGGYLRDDLAPTIDTGHGIMLVVGPPIFLLLWALMVLVGRFLIAAIFVPGEPLVLGQGSASSKPDADPLLRVARFIADDPTRLVGQTLCYGRTKPNDRHLCDTFEPCSTVSADKLNSTKHEYP